MRFLNANEVGYVENITDGKVIGWYYTGEENTLGNLNVIIDGNIIQSITSDIYRMDLAEAGYNNGVCAFEWKIDENYLDGQKHNLKIVSADTDKELVNSSFDFVGLSTKNKKPKTNLIAENIFKMKLSDTTIISEGVNLIDNGVQIAVDRNSVNRSYVESLSIELPEFLINTPYCPAIHVSGKNYNQCTDIFIPISSINVYIASPLFFEFAINSRSQRSLKIECHLGYYQEDEFVTCIKNKSEVASSNCFSLKSFKISGNACNKLFLKNRMKKFGVRLRLIGKADFFISDPYLGFLKYRESTISPNIGHFEDNVIDSQAVNIKGFFPDAYRDQNETDKENINSFCTSLPFQRIAEIIVPVFNQIDIVEQCLNSICERTNIPHIVTIINDGSDIETSERLRKYIVRKPWMRLIENNINLGYTRSINKALRQLDGQYAIILNSDTIVTNGWLTGLLECLEHESEPCIVGPLSNAASWQSVPEIKDKNGGWAVNEMPKDFDEEDIAEIITRESKCVYPEVPIVNGVCMAIDRSIFEIIGYFDDDKFPTGYGEENDFCLRARQAGLKLYIADNVYIYHHKSKSFGKETREKLCHEANQVLKKRYGDEVFKNVPKDMKTLDVLEGIREHLRKLRSAKK